ncbi:hypothetical protein HYC85_011873 [Camellia sinensis]|uniref:Uncharacterized protein n=1 Tax=Camellia sinensis TaxID=4442 RepID=A0A7J7HAB6_CAMSI|nr:hypothetical protein HYC85_011873 [Camellia sinensis]
MADDYSILERFQRRSLNSVLIMFVKNVLLLMRSVSTCLVIGFEYAIAKFAKSFEMVPKTLAENAGLNAMEIISSLYGEHASGNTKVGIDLEKGACKDVFAMNIWDLHVMKFFALKYVADVACIVLRVDQFYLLFFFFPVL